MKSTKKFISVFLVVLMLITSVTATMSVSASTGVLCDKYATNPNGKVGVQKTITIDGDMSDWSSDMLIAQGAAWDVANHYKGGHENCVLDTYALFASWDNDNLYVAWQMVNTTDTWAREGDGPLSDGGRVLDVPLILALSVDPSSTSMSNKNTDGNPIWGQKMGLKFEQHVDHLLYMSGKPGLGTPAMFTAVDANGNTNYTTGCHNFASTGIQYKMAEGNICDEIIGLDYSESPEDVYSNDANWVDYKTFKGSSGTHNTKYDSFYEIKIPLSSLGIDASYLANNGIGAMVVATRGESGLDCIPFDDTMLDNATGDYGNDPSTSHEKDDEDVITSEFARIGNTGSDVPVTQPTTVAPTTQPVTEPATTVPVTTEPVTEADKLTVNATSNLFGSATATASKDANTVTVAYDLESPVMNLVNGQWSLKYDSSKLSFDPAKNLSIMPYITGYTNHTTGKILGNFSNVETFDFKDTKRFVQVTFDVIGTGNANVDLEVIELSLGYFDNNALVYENYIVNSSLTGIQNIPGFEDVVMGVATNIAVDEPATTAPTVPTEPSTTVPTTQPTTQPTTDPVADTLKVNATSNILTAVSETYNADDTVTVTYELESSLGLVNSNWVLSYDNTKLALDTTKNSPATIAPNTLGAIINITENEVKGIFSNLYMYDFSTEKTFVTVTFDVIGTGETDVDLYFYILGVGYVNAKGETVEAYPVDFGEVKDITGKTGFENFKMSGEILLSEPSNVPTYALGDANLDGVVNVKDSTLVQKYSVGLSTLTAQQKTLADVNGDGVVNVVDATTIQKFGVGLIKSF